MESILCGSESWSRAGWRAGGLGDIEEKHIETLHFRDTFLKSTRYTNGVGNRVGHRLCASSSRLATYRSKPLFLFSASSFQQRHISYITLEMRQIVLHLLK